jgi:hypothetical protein
MGVIVDQLDLVDTEPDPPRDTGAAAPRPPTRDDVQTVALLRHAARRHARIWAD